MDTVTLPYKLQVWLPTQLREDLKDLARERGLTLQTLVVTILQSAITDPPTALAPERPRRTPVRA
jgi:hypothetical protein